MIELLPEEDDVIRIFNHYVSRMALILLLMELGILLAAADLAALADMAHTPHGGNALLAGLVFALSLVFIMGTLGMYGSHVCDDMASIVVRILPAFGLGYALLSVMLHAVPSLACLFGAFGVLATRLLLRSSAYSGILVQRLILVGDGPLARECLELARSQRGLQRFEVVGFVPSADAPGSLLALTRHHSAHEVVVAIDERRGGDYPVRGLLECALGGVCVTDAATFFEREAAQIRVDSLQPSYLTFGGGFDQGPVRTRVKRAFDLVASAAVCLLALPLMGGAALAIRLEDGGPVIYRQERVGRDGRLFQLLKFRSMCQDAEQDGIPRWAQSQDERITRVGFWLRKLRIDELPQMINVFRGEMSFVGPRPERAYFVAKLGRELAYYDVRHTIKPGITGLAQVRYQYGASVEDALRYLDGLFTQANLGIVTSLGLWLMPQTESIVHFLCSVPQHAQIGAVVDALRPLRLQGVLRSILHIGNDLRVLSGGMTFPHALAPGAVRLPDELRTQLCQAAGIGAWTVSGALYGAKAQLAYARRALRMALAPTRASVQFVDERSLKLGGLAASVLGGSAAGRKLSARVALGRSLFEMNRGIPNGRFLAGAYWRRRGGLPPGFPAGANPALDNCGILWVSPVLPMRGADMLRACGLAEPVFRSHGFDLFATFSMINERALGGVLTIAFDKEDAAETARAHACYAELFDTMMAAGYIPYRVGQQSLDKLDNGDDSYWRTVARIKAALDPQHIIAPGRYGPG